MYIQQLSLAILAIVILFSIFDYKKTVLIWLPAQLLFNAQVALRYDPPAMSLQIAVNIYLIFFYYIKFLLGKRRNTSAKNSFPLWGAGAFILLSYILSSVISPYGTFRGYTTAIKYFFTNIGSVFLAYKILETEKDIKFFFKYSAIVFTIIILLGISEFVLNDNLWADFVYFGSPHDDTTIGRMFYTPPILGGSYQIRYGMIRAISTFGIHIEFGVACLVYFWLFMLVRSRKFYYISSKLLTLTAFMILLGVFLCNSKTGMVGLVFILFSLFSIRQLITPGTIFAFLVCIAILLIAFPDFLQNFIGLFDSDVAEEGGGSTVSGRQRQFEVALRMFLMNPIFGNGVGALEVLRNSGDNSDILGAESVWMQILPERGVFGMLAFCYLYFAYYKYSLRYLPKKISLFFLISIFVMSTATGELSQVHWGVVLIVATCIFRLKASSNGFMKSN